MAQALTPASTTADFFFGGTDVESFLCQLDVSAPVECVSPHRLTRLAAGKHTFTVTPGNPVILGEGLARRRLHQVEEPKSFTWTVQPRFQLLPHKNDTFQVRKPLVFTETYTIAASSPNASLSVSQFTTTFVDSAMSSITPTLEVEANGQSRVTVSVSAESMALIEGNHTATIVVRDTFNPNVVSEAVFQIALEVFPRAKVLMFTSSGGSTGSLVESIVAGKDPDPAVLWLINIADGGVSVDFGIDVDDTSWRGGGTLEAVGGAPPMTGWVSVSLQAGTIQYSGGLAEIYVNFTTAPTQVQVMEMAFMVSNSKDAEPQKLGVEMRVVADVISNRTAVVVDETNARVAGDNAAFLIDPRDQYDNQLDANDQQVVNQVNNLVVDMFRVDADQGDPKVVGLEVSPMVRNGALFSAAMQAVTPDGTYRMFLRLRLAEELLQDPLVSYPGGSWVDPQYSQLQGSPLNYTFVKVVCNAVAHLVPSDAGSECICEAGFVDTAPPGEGTSPALCVACPVGQYKAATDSVCQVCDTTRSTLAAGATSVLACVCAPGYLTTAAADCEQCPAGYYQDEKGAGVCKMCPPGTYSTPGAPSVDTCLPCGDRTVAPFSGTAQCLPCVDERAVTVGDNRVDCFCQPGFHSEWDGPRGAEKKCQDCPQGARCEGDRVIGLDGYWRANWREDTLYKCDQSAFCRSEAQGMLAAGILTAGANALNASAATHYGLTELETSNMTEPQLVSMCRTGHTGRMCQQCIDQYTIQGLYCQKCLQTVSGTSRYGGIVLFVSATIALLTLWLVRPFFKAKEARARERLAEKFRGAVGKKAAAVHPVSDDVVDIGSMGTRRADLNEVRGTSNERRMADGRRLLVGDERGSGSGAEGFIYPAATNTPGTRMTTIRNYLKIFIGFFQVLGSFDVAYDIPWPSSLLNLINAANFVNIPVLYLPGISCLYPRMQVYQALSIYFLLPILLVSYAAAVHVAAPHLIKRFRTRKVTDEEAYSFTSHVIRTVLFFFFLAYPSLSATMLRVFNCMEIHGEWYIKQDVSIPCYDSTHNGYQVLAAVGVLLYPIGIPVLFYGLLIRYQVMDLARHKRQAAVLQLALRNGTSKLGDIWKMPEVMKFVREQDGNRARMYAEMPADLLRLILDHIEMGHVNDNSDDVPDLRDDINTEGSAWRSGMSYQETGEGRPQLRRTLNNMESFNQRAGTAASKLTQAMFRRGNDAEKSNEASEELEREALMQCFVHWALAQKDPWLKRLPKMEWSQYKDVSEEEAAELTVYERREREACSRVGFIFTMYHTETWWYEIADLVSRKLALTGLIVFVDEGSAAQVAVGVFVCFVALAASLDLSPMFDTEVNRVSNLALAELYLVLFLGLLLKVDTIGHNQAESVVFSLLVGCISVMAFVYPLYDLVVKKVIRKTPQPPPSALVKGSDDTHPSNAI